MISNIRKNISNIKLRSKILIGMITISTFCLMFISVFCYQYFAKIQEKQVMDNVHYTITTGSLNLSDEMNQIVFEALRLISTPRVQKIITSFTEESDRKNYAKQFQEVQGLFVDYQRTSDYIDTVCMFGSNGEYYGISDYGWNFNEEKLLELIPSGARGIVLLPEQRNDITKINMTIPVVFPLNKIESGEIPVIRENVKEAVGRLVVFLNTNKILNDINAYNQLGKSNFYLSTTDGSPLTESRFDIAYEKEFKQRIEEVVTESQYNVKSKDDTYKVMVQDVDACGIKLISITSLTEILKEFQSIKSFILMVWLISMILAILFSFFVSDFITRKMRRLIIDVQKIEYGTYEVQEITVNDEVSKLRESINSMYITIKEQMLQIKKEAEEKNAAEIQALSEQVNPHFLYNTLDCIKWEIIAGDKDNSTKMIECLSDYLRIGLSQGRQIITVKEEISHVVNYMYIMNLRSSDTVEFSTEVEEGLHSTSILKLILQPLVENSLKHGFGKFDFLPLGFLPKIIVRFYVEGKRLIIEVEDNGKGIDITKAMASKNRTMIAGEKHVGIYNVYRRLSTCYGEDVELSFHSMPFYKNIVRISIPYVTADMQRQ